VRGKGTKFPFLGFLRLGLLHWFMVRFGIFMFGKITFGIVSFGKSSWHQYGLAFFSTSIVMSFQCKSGTTRFLSSFIIEGAAEKAYKFITLLLYN
jgi:hypothetical protein